MRTVSSTAFKAPGVPQNAFKLIFAGNCTQNWFFRLRSDFREKYASGKNRMDQERQKRREQSAPPKGGRGGIIYIILTISIIITIIIGCHR